MKNIKRVLTFILVALFILPVSAKAQFQDRYEQQSQDFSNEELAQILAPIALYPDALLSQVLIAASYPYEVAEADRWLSRNPNLSDEQFDQALQEKDWDVSILSLCYYPKVINMMAENLTWTAKLGDAFVYQQQDVMDTVQDLRARAAAQGNLQTTDEQRVIVEERIIRIEPAYYSYMYVPVYDPLVVYGPWWYPAFLPFRIFYPGVIVAGPRIVFSPRIFLGFGVIGWSHFDWHARHIIIRDIDRTKRFNRNYNTYHKPQQHVYWKANAQKRTIHERRRQEYPRYRSIAQPSQSAPKRSSDTVTTPRIKRDNTRPAVKPQIQPTRPQVQPSVNPQKRTVKPQTQPAVKPRTQSVNPQTQSVVKPQAKPVGAQAPSVNKPQVWPVQPQERRVINGGRTATKENSLKGVINQSPKSSAGSRGSERTVQNNGRGNQQLSPAAQRGAGSAQGGRDFRR
ncbi:MAG: DUF3300 domain-containing protein [Syntrophaceae bacterium]|nr:DUF3300 domain-containing protein [Syntrophaceae bacterium]